MEIEVKGRNDTYIVNVTNEGYTCTCPGYKFRKTCSHIEKVAQDGHKPVTTGQSQVSVFRQAKESFAKSLGMKLEN